MESKKTEKQQLPATNGHVPSNEKQKDGGKQSLSKKVYVKRNSVLTDLMEINHLQSVYNISVAVCCLLFLNAIFFYVAAPHKFWSDMEKIRHGVDKFHYFILIWSLFHLLAYLVLKGFKLWIVARNTINSKIADFTFLFLFIGSSIFMFVAGAYAVIKLKIPPVTAFATMAEQVRIFMKIYSFIRESAPRVLQYKPLKDGRQDNLCPSTGHFFYYLFAPALIYCDSYPKSNKINWTNVFTNLFKFVGVVFIMFCALMRFNIDMFNQVGLKPFNRVEAALIFAGAMAVGSIMMFVLFYGILHCWLNFMGELTRFGDKEFYQDWWNSTSFSQYYRRWNSVVYDWLHAYIHQDSQRLGLNRSISTCLVFFMSALFHEYIICLAIGFFYPVLCVVYSTIGVILVFITKGKTSQAWNTFMWFMLFSGWGVVISCYSAEWFARINCPKQETAWDFFIPRSWNSSCHITNFT